MNKEPIRATLKFYRKSATDPSHVYKHYDAKAGDEYIEFLETWERPWGDEQGKEIKRLSQEPTGKRFSFIDVVSPEFLHDNPEEKDVGDEMLMRPEDYMMIRLKEIKT